MKGKTKFVPVPDEEDYLRIDSSIIDIRSFIVSTLHVDFQREMDVQIAHLTALLDDPNMEYTGRDYDLFRGGKRKAIELKDVFIRMLEGLEGLEEQKEQKD